MSGNSMRDFQNERVAQAVETEEASPTSEAGPVISPAQAGALLSGPINKVQRQAIIQSVGQHYGNRQVQRLVSMAQRSASAGPEGGPLESELISRIQSERSNGQPMDTSVRREVEGTLGHDLSPVRIHSGPTAADLSSQMGAKAFTTGRDIFLGENASASDKELITHEATHTIQQGMSEDAPSTIGAADTAHEKAAEHNAAHGSPVGAGVQREAEGEEEEAEGVQMMRDPDIQREAEEEEEAEGVQMMRDPALQREMEGEEEEGEEGIARMMDPSIQREMEGEEEEADES
jgi:hypothetical protein